MNDLDREWAEFIAQKYNDEMRRNEMVCSLCWMAAMAGLVALVLIAIFF